MVATVTAVTPCEGVSAAAVSATAAMLGEGRTAVQTQGRDAGENQRGTKSRSILHNITKSLIGADG
jgi:hypothetical protein